MHEYAVTEAILGVVLEAAGEAGARRVTAIDLVIGQLSSVVDDSVQFYFDILSRGTPAEGATLRFRRVAATVTCGACGSRLPAATPLPPACPVCGHARLQVSGGREFYVESIEVEDEDTGREADSERERSDCGREPGAV